MGSALTGGNGLATEVAERSGQSRNSVTFMLGALTLFAVLVFFTLLVQNPVHSVIEWITTYQSEYGAQEQLTKFLLAIVVLCSVLSYDHSETRWELLATIGYLLLGLTIYLAESNMIDELAQPLFGAVLCGSLFVFLVASRCWRSVATIFIAFGLIGFAVLSDISKEGSHLNFLPPPVLQLLQALPEEEFDLLGIAMFACSATLFFEPTLKQVIRAWKGRLLAVVGSVALITIGNGFLHYQYHPGRKWLIGSSLLTLVGICLFVALTRSREGRAPMVSSWSEANIYYCLVIVFFILPLVFGGANIWRSLVFWGPSMFVAAVCLWRNHPLNMRNEQ